MYTYKNGFGVWLSREYINSKGVIAINANNGKGSGGNASASNTPERIAYNILWLVSDFIYSNIKITKLIFFFKFLIYLALYFIYNIIYLYLII